MKKYSVLLLLILVSGVIYYQTVSISKGNQKENEEVTTISVKAKIYEKNRESGWKKLACGLWKDKDGNIGYEARYAIVSDEKEEALDYEVAYITEFGYKGESLNKIIDTTTFHQLNNSLYYKDKNHIYRHYVMIDGGYFLIEKNIDYTTFQVLNTYYGKDKNNVYESRKGVLEEVDVSSFEIIGESPFAKDKNNYYCWGNITSIEEIRILEKETGIKIFSE